MKKFSLWGWHFGYTPEEVRKIPGGLLSDDCSHDDGDDLHEAITVLVDSNKKNLDGIADILVRPIAQLRHAYTQLLTGKVTDPTEMARGLIGPQVVTLEMLYDLLKRSSR